MSVGVAVAVAAIVVGMGGALATLAAWGAARRSLPRRAAASVDRPRLSRNRRLSMSGGAVLAGLLTAVIAIVSSVFVIPGKPRPPAAVRGSSVVPTAVLSDPGSQGTEDVAFSPDGTFLATVDLKGSVYLWSSPTRKVVATLTDPNSDGAGAAAFSPSGTMLAVGDRNGGTYLWRVSGGSSAILVRSFRCDGASGVNALAFRLNGALATGNSVADGQVCIWTPTTGKVLPGLHTSGGVSGLAFSPDGRLLAVGTASGTVYLWDMATGKLAATLLNPDSERVSSIAFSPDGKVLAVGSLTGQTELWDVASRRLVGTLVNPGSLGVSSVAFSPDGTTLAMADVDGKTYLWDVALSRIIAVLADPGSESVSAVAFSPGGRLIATADLTGNTYLWKYQSS